MSQNVKNNKNNNTNNTLKTVIITVLVVLIILAILGYFGYYWFIDTTLSNLANEMAKNCKESGPPTYTYPLTIPMQNGIYQKNIATSLNQISVATSLANCQVDTPLPPPFTNQQRIYGVDIHNKQTTMYAIIFWNSTMACFAFTGTYSKEEWRDDLRFDQVPATKLSGSITGLPVSDSSNNPNTMVHRGFYEIYTSIQPQLKDWWNQNKFGKQALFMCGRSLGGAQSTLCAFDFANGPNGTTGGSNSVPIVHYSLASPRVGNNNFAETFDKRSPNSIRIYNVEDIIVTLPPSSWQNTTYCHVCINRGTFAFNKSLGSNYDNHVTAYDNLASCFQNVAPC